MEKDGIPVCSSEFGPAHTGHRGDMGFRASRAPHDARVFFSNLHYRSNRRRPELLFDYFQVFRTISH
jgi:hypothetical protein